MESKIMFGEKRSRVCSPAIPDKNESFLLEPSLPSPPEAFCKER
jgi:hypothetical protein